MMKPVHRSCRNRKAAFALDFFLQDNPGFLAPFRDVLVIRAESHPYLDHFRAKPILCLQTSKAHAFKLSQRGLSAVTSTTEPVDLCILFAGKHRAENLYHFARGMDLLRPAGALVCSCPNDLGAATLEKKLAAL